MQGATPDDAAFVDAFILRECSPRWRPWLWGAC